ncbi:MAG: ABC transporter permease [Acetobacteraceae bacterium]
MARLVLGRVASGVLTIFLLSLLIFLGTEILPGDVATALLGQSGSQETLEAIRQSLGLHDPPPLRYWHWLSSFLSGDLGLSLANRTPIGPELWARTQSTFLLAGLAAVITVPVSLALGIATAVWRNSIFDRVVNILGLAAISLPEFFIAYLLILVFAVDMNLFPSLSAPTDDMSVGAHLWSIALPALTLMLAVLGYIMRMTRTAILSVLSLPYIEMAILKGVPPWRIVLFHALPNALAPIIQVTAYNLAYMVVGVVLVEVVFVYPGVGQYLVDAVSKRDVPVVQDCGMVFGATYVGLNAFADILVILVNPRLRHSL